MKLYFVRFFTIFFLNLNKNCNTFEVRKLQYQHGKGPYNIFILDTSSSLGAQGFTQLKETFIAIIDGNVCCLNQCND